MHQQFMTSASAQLNYKTTDELRDIFGNDDKLDEIVDEIVKSLENEKDSIINENRSLAEKNLEVEPVLIEARSRIMELTNEGRELAEGVQSKLQIIKSKSSSVNPESMLDILKASAAESEEKSDEITENFMSQSIAIDEFLDKFKSTRMEMHLRKLKVDKMQELLRQGVGNGQHPPPQGNFYNSAPYPQEMPGGYPMMPMPPIYRSPY